MGERGKKSPVQRGDDTMESAQLGRRIRALRKQRGLSTGEFAYRLKITKDRLAKYETGRTLVRSTTLLKIAGVLDVPVLSFFTRGAAAQPADDELVKGRLTPSKQLLKALRSSDFLRLMERSARAANFHKKNLSRLTEALSKLEKVSAP